MNKNESLNAADRNARATLTGTASQSLWMVTCRQAELIATFTGLIANGIATARTSGHYTIIELVSGR